MAARQRWVVRGLLGAALAFVIVLAGCGGGGSSSSSGSGTRTYVVTLTPRPFRGIYVTSIVPAALPQSALASVKRGGARFVDKARGAEACSYSGKIHGLKGKHAYLNGKTVTVKVNGSNPYIPQLCSHFRKHGLDPANSGSP